MFQLTKVSSRVRKYHFEKIVDPKVSIGENKISFAEKKTFDKLFQLNYLRQFREPTAICNSPPPLNPNPIPSTSILLHQILVKNLSAFTNFSRASDEEAEKLLKKPLKSFELLWNRFKTYWKLINWKGQT